MTTLSERVEYVPSEEEPPPSGGRIDTVELAHEMALRGDALETDIAVKKIASQILERVIVPLAPEEFFSTDKIYDDEIKVSTYPLRHEVFHQLEMALMIHAALIEGDFDPYFSRHEAELAINALQREILSKREAADNSEAGISYYDAETHRPGGTTSNTAKRRRRGSIRRKP